MEPPADRFIPIAELRRRFNEGNYADRADAGEFLQVVTRDGHPSQERSGEPYCTRSQIIEYWTHAGQKIATVHRYLRADGTIGASGKLDPKVLVERGVRYRALGPEQGPRC